MQRLFILLLCSFATIAIQAQVEGYVEDAPVPTEFSVGVPDTIRAGFFMSFRMPDEQKLEWHIYTSEGRKEVKEKWGKKGPGVYVAFYNIKSLPAGRYTFKAVHGEATYETTFEKIAP